MKKVVQTLSEDELNEKEIKPVNVKKEIIEWIFSILGAVLVAAFIFKFVAFFAYIPTGSMIPTIPEKSRVLVLKFLRYFDWEHRGLTYGDIVVFEFDEENMGSENQENEKLYVKRVIGMPGDKIVIDNGYVYRNGEKLNEPYVKNKDSFFMNEFVVPENEIFVLGDNRTNSYDSRYWKHKTVPFENVVGEIKFR